VDLPKTPVGAVCVTDFEVTEPGNSKVQQSI